MNCDVKAYEGSEPFIFISYAHDDAHMVYPIVERLVMDGFRVWYDDGIHAGEDWTDKVASRLDASTICIPMLTENYVQSVNCRNELAYSLNAKKTVISIKLTDFDVPGGIKLQLGNAKYLERYRYGETEFYESLQISHGISECRDETPRITDTQLMAWRSKWENATPIKRAQGDPERVKLHGPDLSRTEPAKARSKKPLIIALAAVAVALAVLAIVLLPRLTGKDSPAQTVPVSEGSSAAELEASPQAEPEPQEAEADLTEDSDPAETVLTIFPDGPEVYDGMQMDVLAYECSEGFSIFEIACVIRIADGEPLLETTVTWEGNTQVASLFNYSTSKDYFDSATIAKYQKDFYSVSNMPRMVGGTVSDVQTCTNMIYFFPSQFCELTLCFDTEGNVVGYIQMKLDYPSTGEEDEAEAVPVATPALVIQNKTPMDVLSYESTPGFEISSIECNVIGRGANAEFEIIVSWADNTQVGTIKSFMNMSQPIPASDITKNQKDYYKKTNSPLVCDGEIEQVQYAYHGVVPAAGPVYLLCYCFDQDGTIIAYITLEVDYPQDED